MAAEKVILPWVDGSAQVAQALTDPVAKLAEWNRLTAQKTPQRPTTPLAKGIAGRVWQMLTMPQSEVNQRAAYNATEYQKQLRPLLARAGQVAKNVATDANKTHQEIWPQLAPIQKVASKALSYSPDILSSGASREAKIANNVIGTVMDLGNGTLPQGAFFRHIIPGNSMIANFAQDAATDFVAQQK